MLFLGLGLLELAFFAVFFILLIIGASWDRRGNWHQKWYIFGVGIWVIATWSWPEWTFFGSAMVPAVMDGANVLSKAHTRIVLWDIVRAWTFWTPVACFLGAGVVYALLEFFLEVRRAAHQYKKTWALYMDKLTDVHQFSGNGDRVQEEIRLKNHVILADTEKVINTRAKANIIQAYVDSNSSRTSLGFIRIKKLADNTGVEPVVDKVELAEHIGAWVLFWPAYAISLIIGDLLTEVFNMIASFFVHLSSRFVRKAFSDVFKFN